MNAIVILPRPCVEPGCRNEATRYNEGGEADTARCDSCMAALVSGVRVAIRLRETAHARHVGVRERGCAWCEP